MMQFLLFLLSHLFPMLLSWQLIFLIWHRDDIDFIIAVLGVVGDVGDRKTVKEMKA